MQIPPTNTDFSAKTRLKHLHKIAILQSVQKTPASPGAAGPLSCKSAPASPSKLAILGLFLHETRQRRFMQTFLVTFVMLFCTKPEILISCRLFRKNPARISAQKRNSAIRAENARESQQKTLHKNAILHFLRKTPANRNKKLCTKTQSRNSCRKHPQIVVKNSAQKRNLAIHAENARESQQKTLHESAILQFLQKTPANRSKKLCTKALSRNICRKRPRIAEKTLHESAISQFMQKTPASPGAAGPISYRSAPQIADGDSLTIQLTVKESV